MRTLLNSRYIPPFLKGKKKKTYLAIMIGSTLPS